MISKKMWRIVLIAYFCVNIIGFDTSMMHVYASTNGEYEYSINSDGKAVIVSYYGTDTEVVIPSQIDGYEVVELGKNLFKDNTALTSVVIPSTIEVINDYAFYCCTNLYDVNLPKSLKYLGGSAFYNCDKIESIIIPAGIKFDIFSSQVFKDCDSLKDVVIEDGVEQIAMEIFCDCDAIEKIEMPDSVKYISWGAFKGCTSLKEVKFSQNMVQMLGMVFEGCSSIDNVVISSPITSIEMSTFKGCTNLSEIILPETVTKIGTDVFTGCTNLSEIMLPETVTKIDSNAFSGCSKLTKIFIPRGAIDINSNSFEFKDILTIYGNAGTYVETYANSNNIRFVNGRELWLNKTGLVTFVGDKDKLELNVFPRYSSDIISWKSSDNNIVTVDEDGNIEAVGAGTAYIKAYVNELSISCVIEVVGGVESVNFEDRYVVLENVKEYRLKPIVLPENYSKKTLKWSSSDENIATVDEDGFVNVKNIGIVNITVETVDGSEKKDTCTLEILSLGSMVNDVECLESEHDYTSNMDERWKYTIADANGLSVTFDKKTSVEEQFDFIYVYGAGEKLLGKYTGTELAGETIDIEGNTVEIRLTSDERENGWGFKVTNIKRSNIKQVRQFVERMYICVLGREADEIGFENWVTILMKGNCDGAGIAKEFVLGAEFELRNYSNEQYVDTLYKTFFDREADEEGRNLWLAELASGKSREYVLSNFVNLQEFTILCDGFGIERGVMLTDGNPVSTGITQFVRRLYEKVLYRDVDNEGLYNHTFALASKLQDAETVAKEFFKSEEYRLKNKNNEDYIHDLYEVFMNREADEMGFKFWVDTLALGMSREEVISQFSKSEEFGIITKSYGLE